MTGVHIYIRKHIGSYRIVSRRPRHSIDTFNNEHAATARVPSPVTLVPLDELHSVLHSRQATQDSHLTDGDTPHLPADLLEDIQAPTDAESEQSDSEVSRPRSALWCHPFAALRAGSEPFASLKGKLREGSAYREILRYAQDDRTDFDRETSLSEEDGEDTQKGGAIKIPNLESTEQEALSTAVPDDFHHRSDGQNSRLLEVVVLATRIVLAIIIVLFFIVFPRIVLPKSTLHATLQLPAGIVATATVPVPIPGLTITPDHINATTGCTFVQSRYRCIITLTLSRNHHNKLKWSISRSGLTATFSPSKGRLRPGHPQQIVIFIYNDCPHSGSLIFSVGGKTIPIVWSC